MPNFSASNSAEQMNLQNRISTSNYISPCIIISIPKSLTSLFSVYNPTAYMSTWKQKENSTWSKPSMAVGIQTKFSRIKFQQYGSLWHGYRLPFTRIWCILFQKLFTEHDGQAEKLYTKYINRPKNASTPPLSQTPQNHDHLCASSDTK
jgi:hypothetical protein